MTTVQTVPIVKLSPVSNCCINLLHVFFLFPKAFQPISLTKNILADFFRKSNLLRAASFWCGDVFLLSGSKQPLTWAGLGRWVLSAGSQPIGPAVACCWLHYWHFSEKLIILRQTKQSAGYGLLWDQISRRRVSERQREGILHYWNATGMWCQENMGGETGKAIIPDAEVIKRDFEDNKQSD